MGLYSSRNLERAVGSDADGREMGCEGFGMARELRLAAVRKSAAEKILGLGFGEFSENSLLGFNLRERKEAIVADERPPQQQIGD